MSLVERVLVPTDFSVGAQRALARAMSLPLAPRTRLVLLHVAPEGLRADEESAARELLAQTAALVSPRPGLELIQELAVGKPHEQIIHRARIHDAQLVVLGRRGTRGLRDRLLGTTADRVVRYGETPVLVVAIEPHGPYRRPLLATSLDDTASRLLQIASAVIEPEVVATVMHAYHVPFENVTYVVRPPIRDEDIQAEARRVLDDLLVQHPQLRWRGVLRRGEASSSIMLEQIELDADLVVLGTHGRSGLAHALLGSVAEHVLAAMPCDVLVARPARFSFALP